MNTQQLKAATETMIEWLEHPSELGKTPAAIECAGTFERYGELFYIFKYKKTTRGKWLFGIAGGYQGDSLESSLYTFSQMEEYHEETAEEDAIALVDYLKDYMSELSQRPEHRKGESGVFIHYLLLEKPEWDKEAIINRLHEEWGIEDDGTEPEEDDDEEEDVEGQADSFICTYHGAMIIVSLMKGPIPDDEAAYAATFNGWWEEGFDEVKKHKAFIAVAVKSQGMPLEEAGKLLIKLTSTIGQLHYPLGVYTGEVVLEPETYFEDAQIVKEEKFPTYNLIWIGLSSSKKGLCGYTAGMQDFGYDEMEVLDTNMSPIDLSDFIADIATHVITQKVVLNDGDTIDYRAGKKLKVSKSEGVVVDGDSLKISF